jgi:hypothetical protein
VGDLAVFPPADTRARMLAAADETWPGLGLVTAAD